TRLRARQGSPDRGEENGLNCMTSVESAIRRQPMIRRRPRSVTGAGPRQRCAIRRSARSTTPQRGLLGVGGPVRATRGCPVGEGPLAAQFLSRPQVKLAEVVLADSRVLLLLAIADLEIRVEVAA